MSNVETRMDQPVRAIMTNDVWTVTPSMPLEDAVHILLEHHISGLPVVDAARGVVGVVTLTDIAKKLRGQAPQGTIFYSKDEIGELLDSLTKEPPADGVVRDVMSAQVIAVRPDATVREAARRMVADRIHRVLVVDAAGKLVG